MEINKGELILNQCNFGTINILLTSDYHKKMGEKTVFSFIEKILPYKFTDLQLEFHIRVIVLSMNYANLIGS